MIHWTKSEEQGMKISKSRGTQLISCLYAFLLTLIFVVLFLCTGVGVGVFNGRSIHRNMNESKYYEEVYRGLYTKTSQDIEAAGLPLAVLEDVITQERVYITGQNYVMATLNSEDYIVSTDRLKETLERNLNQYLRAKGAISTTELESELAQLVNSVAQDYQDAIRLPLLDYVVEYRTYFLSTIRILGPILIVLAAALCVLLLRMYRYAHRGLRFIAYAMISASVLMSVMAGYLMASRPYNKIILEPEYYQDFIRTYLRWNITVLVYISGMGIILSMLLISLVSFMRNRMKNT
jgi:hypothetical protein